MTVNGRNAILIVIAGTSLLAFAVWFHRASFRAAPMPYVPAASIVNVQLALGVDAPAGKLGRSVPAVVLLGVIGIESKVGWVSKSTRCVILANAYGDTSITRVMLEARAITCEDAAGKTYRANLKGVVVDNASGRVGVPGTLVTERSAETLPPIAAANPTQMMRASKIHSAVRLEAGVTASLMTTAGIAPADWTAI